MTSIIDFVLSRQIAGRCVDHYYKTKCRFRGRMHSENVQIDEIEIDDLCQ